MTEVPKRSQLPIEGRAEVKRESATVIKTRLEQGRYEVDPRRVADAIIARLAGDTWPSWATNWSLAQPGLQKECSKPPSSPSASPNTAAG